eukprot:CAMPEP_0194352348 /NCGR_PEP_ID=MMETSP0174-20130528/741_1 /TAXON_ID=216777 /ORGANISM="Proboscia alata, Strain PI-D3" /LENGTH=1095 /DNA_ID=CAMNT_0039120341 /DNA_START=121 /DNA_END=3408 /DNA_ORIENTATION=-
MSAPVPKGTAKRDALRTNERSIQSLWEDEKVYEVDAEESSEREKFMVTFPYPYSNGNLHIGHAFSLTKSVFRAQYERHLGKNVLWPFAFHCTGMPIQAAANKLKSELELYGTPPSFPENDPKVRAQMEAEIAAKAAEAAAKAKLNVSKKKKGNKTKLVQKSGTGIVRQWTILAKMVPLELIPSFIDPLVWLSYFPPRGVTHLNNFGAGVDWRRSFITTAVNPYYDAFIRWQFETLRKRGKVLFGKRNNVFSIVDGQVCADHDRSEGEGVGPQEYTLIKLKLLEVPDPSTAVQTSLGELLGGDLPVSLVAATLRPETMYGQTNLFVLPTGTYGAYKIELPQPEIFIMSHRAARGLSCQGYTQTFAEIECLLGDIKGTDLLGLPVKAPNSSYERVYTLPLLTISMGKGTGIVTSVPSDAPDDYVALQALKIKPDFAAKYGITPAMVDPFDVIPIIDIPGYGSTSAVFVCEKLKITSFNDKAKLAQAKEETYLKGFTSGVMIVGPHAGTKVSDAKPIIKEEMITDGTACLYFEPESKVMSRTHDECVVAKTDQWYLAYGETNWAQAVKDHVLNAETFNAYDESALTKYEYVIGWLQEWACTRQFGLGTQLPWDTKWVIESLSDSTIYMSYYTIAHILQGRNNLEGDVTKSPHGIDPKLLTNDVFDYIYLKNAPLPTTSISTDLLKKCRGEFRYWYPMDLRVSAKDLIPNHLTMALYNHAAIWDDEPELWPKGYYTNGHVLVDAQKMSKSAGNFLLMDETVELYSADATRFACADAGDSLDDANFSRETADSAIVSLVNEEDWAKEMLEAHPKLRTGEYSFMDRVFDNEMDRCIRATAHSYSTMQFRDGLQHGWHEMLLARNEYRSYCHSAASPLHAKLVTRFLETIVILICPVCPHWSEGLWRNVLKKDITKVGAAVHAPWPQGKAEDKLLTRQSKFLRDSLKAFRQQLGKAKKGWTTASILITDSYQQWKVNVLEWMQEQYKSNGDSFPKAFMGDLKKWVGANVSDKKLNKDTMQFASFVKREVDEVGSMAMDLLMPYDQKAILMDTRQYILNQLNIADIEILKLNDESGEDDEKLKVFAERITNSVTPGRCYLCFH